MQGVTCERGGPLRFIERGLLLLPDNAHFTPRKRRLESNPSSQCCCQSGMPSAIASITRRCGATAPTVSSWVTADSDAVALQASLGPRHYVPLPRARDCALVCLNSACPLRSSFRAVMLYSQSATICEPSPDGRGACLRPRYLCQERVRSGLRLIRERKSSTRALRRECRPPLPLGMSISMLRTVP